ncbi:DUF302 domain-containing protein [Nitratifractor sp.]
MKHLLIAASILVAALTLSGCGGQDRGTFLKEKVSDYNISETARRFAEALKPKNYRFIRLIDHEAEANRLKLYLKPTHTLVLDNPKISAKLLDCNPTMAIELPIRVGIYNELNGRTHLVYTNPEYWSLKHNIKDKTCIELINLLARDFDAATDAIVKAKP